MSQVLVMPWGLERSVSHSKCFYSVNAFQLCKEGKRGYGRFPGGDLWQRSVVGNRSSCGESREVLLRSPFKKEGLPPAATGMAAGRQLLANNSLWNHLPFRTALLKVSHYLANTGV